MARVLFSETSRRWANQLNDLRERWHLRREEPGKHVVPIELFKQDIQRLEKNELLNLKTALIDLLNECKRELRRAQTIAREDGVYLEHDTHNDLTSTIRSIGNHIQKVNHTLGKQRQERGGLRDFPQHFIDVAREKLTKEQFQGIFQEAKVRAEGGL